MANSGNRSTMSPPMPPQFDLPCSLPEAERASLLEVLEDHLAEVASESDVPLRERLGKPEDYAAELRSAYGSASNTPSTKRRWAFRDRVVGAGEGCTWHPAYRELRALLPELRPGWWVLRAYSIVLVLAFILRGVYQPQADSQPVL